MSDSLLVKALREIADELIQNPFVQVSNVGRQKTILAAADAIERLRAENVKLRERTLPEVAHQRGYAAAQADIRRALGIEEGD